MIESKPSVKSKLNNKTIKVDVATKEKIAFLAKALNQKQSNFLTELIENLFAVGCSYPESANLSYMPCITSSYVYLQWAGKNRNLIFGKNQDLEKEIQEKLLNRKSPETAKSKKTKVKVVA